MDNQDFVVPKVKVVVLGDVSVGKSTLSVHFTQGAFVPKLQSTLGSAFLQKRITIPNTNSQIDFQIWDTAGHEKFKTLTPMYYRNSAVALTVFDLSDPSTLEEAKFWLNELKTNVDEDQIRFLVGNKADLEHFVTETQIKEICQTHSLEYIETSAVTGKGIFELFDQIATLVMNKGIAKNPTSTMNAKHSKVVVDSIRERPKDKCKC